MEPSGLVSSAVNMMFDCCSMTKVSSTYLFHILGAFTAVVMALYSNDSIYKYATLGVPPWLSQKLVLEQELGVVQTEFQQLYDVAS